MAFIITMRTHDTASETVGESQPDHLMDPLIWFNLLTARERQVQQPAQ
eukprot:COSAG01_NODE_4432_length_5031_cov_3.848540_7_plen_48_part_00